MNPIDPQEIRRILVITLSNLGDVVLTTPVLCELRRHFPKARMTVLVGPRAFDLLKQSKLIDQLMAYDKDQSLWKRFLLCLRLRREHFDLAIDLRHTIIPQLVGARYRTLLLRQRRDRSMREQHLDRLQELGIDVGAPSAVPLQFDFFQEVDLVRVRRLLAGQGIRLEESIVVMAPGARYPFKSWDPARFAELGLRLQREQGKRVVILGAASEAPTAQVVQNLAHNAFLNLCGSLAVCESAAVIRLADLAVSNDSAIMHLAHALEIPCVGIFGPTNAQKYGREDERSRVIRHELECAPCEKAVCQIEETRKCLTAITVDEVYRAACELLNVIQKAGAE